MSKALVKTVKRDIVSHLNNEFISNLKSEVEEFNATGKRFAELTLRIGMRLEFAKTQLPHGQLNKWIEENAGISVRHARRCRDLAKVFIAAQKVGADEMFALVDPANSQKELAKKLEQMAFDFIADRTQAELFAEYGIQVREKSAQKNLPKPKPKPLPEGETQEHMVAHATWSAIGAEISEYGLSQQSWAHLTDDERWNLYQLVHELDQQLKATFKKGRS